MFNDEELKLCPYVDFCSEITSLPIHTASILPDNRICLSIVSSLVHSTDTLLFLYYYYSFSVTEITVTEMTIIIVRMMGYICTEGLQAREPAATKENEHIKRSLHKAWTKVMI